MTTSSFPEHTPSFPEHTPSFPEHTPKTSTFSWDQGDLKSKAKAAASNATPAQLKSLNRKERFHLSYIILNSSHELSDQKINAIYNKLTAKLEQKENESENVSVSVPKNKTLTKSITKAFNNMLGFLFGNVKGMGFESRLSSKTLQSMVNEKKASDAAKIEDIRQSIKEITGKEPKYSCTETKGTFTVKDKNAFLEIDRNLFKNFNFNSNNKTISFDFKDLHKLSFPSQNFEGFQESIQDDIKKGLGF